jgi:hypothetical protein
MQIYENSRPNADRNNEMEPSEGSYINENARNAT